MANYTPNYQLHQWAPEDKFLRTDFNEDLNKIDTALGTISAETTYPKLLDVKLETDRQKWDVDVRHIDLAQYQKLVIYPHLKGNTDQWVSFHLNGLTSGYYGPGNDRSSCGDVPMLNDPNRQNFGVCEFTLLLELPRLFMIRLGITSNHDTAMPSLSGHRCPSLAPGTTHLDTMNFWFGSTSYHILAGSTVQIYGLRR